VLVWGTRTEAIGPLSAAPTGSAASAAPFEVALPGFRSLRGPTWSFGVPSAWQDVVLPMTVVAAREPAPSNGFHLNANLVTDAYPGDTQAFASANLLTLQSQGVRVIRQQPAMIGGMAASDVEADWPMMMPPTHTIQRYVAYGGYGYVLTCTGLQSDFERGRSTCEQVLGTFRVRSQ